jgi:hypothetical protein
VGCAGDCAAFFFAYCMQDLVFSLRLQPPILSSRTKSMGIPMDEDELLRQWVRLNKELPPGRINGSMAEGPPNPTYTRKKGQADPRFAKRDAAIIASWGTATAPELAKRYGMSATGVRGVYFRDRTRRKANDHA